MLLCLAYPSLKRNDMLRATDLNITSHPGLLFALLISVALETKLKAPMMQTINIRKNTVNLLN